MKRHISYLKYLIRHKFFVMIAGYRVGASMWRCLMHDASKFRPSEWKPYAEYFYSPDGSYRDAEEGYAFKAAWNDHQKRNKHHWQYWVLINDNGVMECLPMPGRYAREMLADWMGAGRAITGQWEVAEWYEKNKSKIALHPTTRMFVEKLIMIIKQGDATWAQSI